MPWEVRFKGGEPKPYKVVKKGSGEVVASHKTREQAQEQVKALYANADKDDPGKGRVRR